MAELKKHVDLIVGKEREGTYHISCPVYVFIGRRAEEKVREFAEKARSRGLSVAIIAKKLEGENVITIGSSPEEYTSNLFSAIRKAESMRPNLIVIEGLEEHEGVMDRLKKLAGERIFRT
nr:Sua5 family C-terminal domain-containing protein [Archaeoglobus neptunius]